MISYKKVVFVCCTLCIVLCKGNIPATLEYRQIVEKLTDAIEYEIRDKNLNAISIVLVRDQEILWADGFGFEDQGKKIKADANTVYRVGSVSKLFTNIGIMQLVEDGEIKLDAPITNYIPEFIPRNGFGKEITLRQLMSHRSGLLREPRTGNYFSDDEPSLEETVMSIIDSEIVYEPESKIKYSNAGIAVVGYVLEILHKEPFASYLRRSVLLPMGLSQSAFEPLPIVNDRLASATIRSYDGRQFPAPKFELGISPAGSMYTTVKDLGQFMKVLFEEGKGPNGPVIGKGALKEMLTSQYNDGKYQGHNVGFGFGFSLSEKAGQKRVGHSGAIYGFSTQFYALLDMKIGVAVTSSFGATNTITRRLSDYALDCFLAVGTGASLPAYVESDPIDKSTVKLLTGDFLSDNGKHLRLIHMSGDLIMENDRIQSRLRSHGGRIITDDKISFGITIDPSEDGTAVIVDGEMYHRVDYPRPQPVREVWQGLIGEYGWDHNILYVYEEHGKLTALIEWIEKDVLVEVGEDVYAFSKKGGMYHGEKLIFSRNKQGIASQVEIENGPVFQRINLGTLAGETFQITPLKSIPELRSLALASKPPRESGKLNPDLIEIQSLDGSVKYDIRYASKNNFMDAKFYRSTHAFMQRPAVEALVRVHRKLKAYGYGLLIYDAYRPWYVTKMFFDATPEYQRMFVAKPANGSRHNRGCAVDLTLYELDSGEVVEMVGGYDEFTARSYPNYIGGTAEQRWHRDLLRRTMESESFTIYEAEWWHFDYKNWNDYPIMNLTFEQLQQKH